MQDGNTTRKSKPTLSFWQIWNMSFGFLGIQFGFALQNSNVSRIFETLGANIDDIPVLWVAAPITGLIMQPIIGYMSDRTWNKLGRRRPYFLVGAILASIALFIMPNSPTLWFAAGMLWIMDASINISMEPFRAFVGDNLPDEQRTIGFATQSFFIGVGAVVAAMLPYAFTNWFGISNEAPNGVIPDSVKWSFYFGGAIFLLAVLWTVFRSFEYSPEEMRAYSSDETTHAGTEPTAAERTQLVQRQIRTSTWFNIIGALLTLWILTKDLKKDLYILSIGLIAAGVFFLLAGLMQRGGSRSGFITMMNDLLSMPKTMKQLAVVQFFSWFALFSMWIYTTSGVTSDKYDMKLNAADLGFLSQKASSIATSDEREKERLESTKTTLAKLQEKLSGGAAETSVEVNLVNYFLDGKLLNEQQLAAGVLQKMGQGGNAAGMPDGFEKELAEVANPAGPAKKTLSADAFQYLLEQKAVLLAGAAPQDLENMAMAAKLKNINKSYNTGANWVSVLFAIYSGVSALVAFLLPVIARHTSRKATHAICLVIGALGLFSIFFIKSPSLLWLSMVGIGFAWASILSMPYAILTGALPSDKMGYFMGVFNFFIVIPQIVAAAILGFFIAQFFQNHAINAMLIGGVSFLLAALLTFWVEDKKGS